MELHGDVLYICMPRRFVGEQETETVTELLCEKCLHLWYFLSAIVCSSMYIDNRGLTD